MRNRTSRIILRGTEWMRSISTVPMHANQVIRFCVHSAFGSVSGERLYFQLHNDATEQLFVLTESNEITCSYNFCIAAQALLNAMFMIPSKASFASKWNSNLWHCGDSFLQIAMHMVIAFACIRNEIAYACAIRKRMNKFRLNLVNAECNCRVLEIGR